MGKTDSLFQRSELQAIMQRQRVYDLESIQREVEKKGFSVVDKGTYFPKFLTHSQLQSCLDKKIINKEILEGIYQLGKYVPEYGSEIFVQLCVEQ